MKVTLIQEGTSINPIEHIGRTIEQLEYELAQTRAALVNLIVHLAIPDADVLEICEANYTYEAVEKE